MKFEFKYQLLIISAKVQENDKVFLCAILATYVLNHDFDCSYCYGSSLFDRKMMTKMKVVFHVSESTHCIPAFNSATNLLKARNGKYTDIHIVFTGSAISTLIADSDESPNWETLQQDNVILLACENAMRANSITLDRLLMGVNSVPAGILALVEHQQDGYFYIKP